MATQTQESKPCAVCGASFFKRTRDSSEQWLEREHCSIGCANKVRKLSPPHLRYWDDVEVHGEDECWPWKGVTDQHGYGRIHFMTEKIKAHRVAYEMRYGPISEGLVVCHKCDNPNCVNPKHLFAGTQRDNAQDMSAKCRINHRSLLNLHPGMSGVRGAGPKSVKEISHGIR